MRGGLGSKFAKITHIQKHLRMHGTCRAKEGIDQMPCHLFGVIKGVYNSVGAL